MAIWIVFLFSPKHFFLKHHKSFKRIRFRTRIVQLFTFLGCFSASFIFTVDVQSSNLNECNVTFVVLIITGSCVPVQAKESWAYVDVRDGAHMFWWLYYANSSSGSYENLPLVMWLQVRSHWKLLSSLEEFTCCYTFFCFSFLFFEASLRLLMLLFI